jgi:YgiT-type zinc finger domain-containing protein
MQCDYCDGETKSQRVRKQHWFQRRLYLMENVPAEVCSECGQRYFHARTLDEIDRLLSGKHEVKENLQVEVVSM